MTLGNIFDILQNLYMFQGVLVGRKLSPFINHVLSQKIVNSTKLRLHKISISLIVVNFNSEHTHNCLIYEDFCCSVTKPGLYLVTSLEL